jgi:hypothetical protein
MRIAARDRVNILLPSYITTIYRATTLTDAAHSHRRNTHSFIGVPPLQCYMKTHRIGLSDGAARPSGLCYRWNASLATTPSAQTRCPFSVPPVGKPSVRFRSQLVPVVISRLSHQQPRPIHRTINAKIVRSGHRIFSEPGPSSPISRRYGKPSARSSIAVNIHWHGHSRA